MKSRKIIFILFIVIIILLLFFFALINYQNNKKENYERAFLKSNTNEVIVYEAETNKETSFYRGKEVLIDFSSCDETCLGLYKDKLYKINKENITLNYNEIVSEDEIYVRTSTLIYEDEETLSILDTIKKGESLEVLSFDKIDSLGKVNLYKVKKGDVEGFVYGKYFSFTIEKALNNNEEYYLIHEKRKDTLGGGKGATLDYFPVEKKVFDNNVMPAVVKAMYLNSSYYTITNIQKYIDIAKKSNINTFIVDIKDNQMPGYKSLVMQEYSPKNFERANNTFENYKNAIELLKESGFYVVGRITVFKDSYLIDDHPEYAILDNRDGEPYLKGGSFWPSAFIRKVWEFNVNLAIEAVNNFGFNEIQFDYVRFPDKATKDEANNILNFQNKYNEEKAEAIQQFLFYACDNLHKVNAYVSADVFGESANSYVTAYGQYWPAISNVVDVISPMPYPDHYYNGSYGIDYPFLEPYNLINEWSKSVVKRQEEIPTPAIVRSWIQVFDVSSLKYPPNGYSYGVKEVEAQIDALNDSNLLGGYMTWNASSDLERYESQIKAYK